MGAQQSTQEDSPTAPRSAMKEDFYTLLGVDRNADQDEIKKAYRKKALELHPDKNVNNVEAATKLFSEVQAAYEVLSDPQERAWYDSHKDQILREDGDDPSSSSAAARPADVTITTQELLKQFSLFSSRMDKSDSNPKGFYSIASKIFSTIASEEESAAAELNEDAPFYPSFGNSKSDYQNDVRAFYNIWTGFSTMKSFSWEDRYRYRDAPDRRVKRLMEKENKKFRDTAIKEFNDTVKQFVLYIRKRDPRYLPNFQSEEERDAAAREASKDQSRRARLENAAKVAAYKEADWSKPKEMYDDETDEEDEDDDEPDVEFECVACNKTFKTENQMEMHEKSKKHIKMVQSIKRQMRKDDAALDLDDGSKSKSKAKKKKAKNTKYFDEEDEEDKEEDDDNDSTENTPQYLEDDEEDDADEGASEELPSKPIAGNDKKKNKRNKNKNNKKTPADLEESDDSLAKDAQKMRIGEGEEPEENDNGDNDDDDDDDEEEGEKKMLNEDIVESDLKPQKSKPKKARRRAAKQSKPEPQEPQNKCGVCNESFDSRTKLFQHIRNENHAAAIQTKKNKRQ
ncbi:hypothetical protein TWF730_006250 [Orbilia blumenaviensis]|uniref:DnaJ-domain-containing protein n=1 Tax=Orbilia blumenaviensis TaxID=1796055 RepID=A0AAV9VGS0_9PEZI